MIPKSVCPLWLADIRSDPWRKARPSAVSYTTPVDTILPNADGRQCSPEIQWYATKLMFFTLWR